MPAAPVVDPVSRLDGEPLIDYPPDALPDDETRYVLTPQGAAALAARGQ